jgi:hypothetical protein
VSIIDTCAPFQGATVFVCLSFFLLITFTVLTSYILFQRHFLISVLSVADVIGIARRVDELELTDLLDPTKEEVLRANTTPVQFQDAQRTRARILFEQMRAMTFNALVILLWAERERKKLQSPAMPRDDLRIQNTTEIAEDGPAVRLVGLVAMTRLGWRIALDAMRIVRLGRLAQVRTFSGADVLEAYRRTTRATVALASAYSRNAAEQLNLILLGRSEKP